MGLLARVDLGEVVKFTVEVVLVVSPRPHLLSLRDLAVEPDVHRDVPERRQAMTAVRKGGWPLKLLLRKCALPVPHGAP